MCNEAARQIALGTLRAGFDQLRIPLVFPEGLPNMAPVESLRITDSSVIVRAEPPTPDLSSSTSLAVQLVTRRWSWPSATGRPVYNFRSEGRTFPNSAEGGRCLIPLTAFFEFTDPPAGSPRSARKQKWRFTLASGPGEARAGDFGEPFFCIAGLWKRVRTTRDAEPMEAFTMLTCDPGPDIAPYHRRQVVLVQRADWCEWLTGEQPQGLLAPTSAGVLQVAPA